MKRKCYTCTFDCLLKLPNSKLPNYLRTETVKLARLVIFVKIYKILAAPSIGRIEFNLYEKFILGEKC